MPAVIRIHHGGGLGNQMFQLMFAEAIRVHRPDASIVGHDMPVWGLSEPDAPAVRGLSITIQSHVTPLREIAEMVKKLGSIEVRIAGISLRYCYYRDHLKLYRKIFRGSGGEPSASRKELVISVRLGNIAAGEHRNYFPLPISYYERLLDETGLNPVFHGQIGDDPYTDALRARFPSSRFVPSAGPGADFDFLRRAPNVASSISSFSWLACWLSETAEQIFLPVAGLFHPGHRADIALLPLDDKRFRFYHSDMGTWKAQEDFANLISGDYPFEPITPKALHRRYPDLTTDRVNRLDARRR